MNRVVGDQIQPSDSPSQITPSPRRRRILKRLLFTLALLYVVGMIIGCAFPDRFILFPSKSHIDVPNATRITISSPTGPLEIWTRRTNLSANAPPQAYVLEFNGNGSRAERELDRVEPMWSDHAVEIWTVNYPGYGGSAGRALLKNIPPAALAAYDAIAKTADGKPIFVSGHSIGTTAALYIAANRPVAGVILHNPPPLRQLIMGRFGWFNLWIAAHFAAAAVPPQLDSIANANHCNAPALFLQATGGTLVLSPYQKMVINAYAGPHHLILLPGYHHNEPVHGAELPIVRHEIDWLWDSVKAPDKILDSPQSH